MPELEFVEDDILIDSEHKNKCLPYYVKEELEDFEKSKDLVDPKYLETPIEYKFNSHGYRTKNIQDLDKEFVLVFGCSHTEGVGNFDEDIWCSQLLSRFDLDFLNLAKAGTGPDIQYLNTLQYIKSHYPRPKAVIYQWPQSFRKSFAYSQGKKIILKHHNINNKTEKRDTNWYIKRYCNELGEMMISNYACYTAVNLLWKNIEIPVLNWSWQGDFKNNYKDLHIIKTRDTGRARDLMHDGADIHRQVAVKLEKIFGKILKTC